MRLERRHIRVYNIAMHAAAKRVEKSQFSLAQSSTEWNGINTDFQASGRDKHTYTQLDKTTLFRQFKQPTKNQHKQRFAYQKVRKKKFPKFNLKI